MSTCTPYTVAIVDGTGDDAQFPAPPPALSPVDINAASGFPLVPFPATAGKFTRIYRLVLTADGPTTITFRDGAAALPGTVKIAAAGETVVLDPGIFPYWQGSVNTDFKLDSSSAVQLTGAIWGFVNAS
ncbi:MAG TPA: hypothetical protein VGG48_14295 [Rhizomicrobium sp.]|jgi:hypothetical protein